MPALSSVYTADEALTNVANQINADSNFIIQEVMPVLPVDKPERKIYRIDPNDEMNRDEGDLDRRPFGEPANAVDYDVSKPVSYSIEDEKAYVRAIPVEIEAAADEIVREALDPVVFLGHKLLKQREIRGVTNLAAGLTNVTPSVKFNNASGAPLTYLRNLADTIRTSGYRRPNVLACDYTVFKSIVTSAEFISEADKLAAIVDDNTPFEARKKILAACLDMPRNGKIVVSDDGALKNTAKHGQTASLSTIWGENMFFGSVDTSISGRTYGGTAVHVEWRNPILLQGQTSDGPFRVRKKFDDDRDANVVRVGFYYDQVIMNAETGRWITNTQE